MYAHPTAAVVTKMEHLQRSFVEAMPEASAMVAILTDCATSDLHSWRDCYKAWWKHARASTAHAAKAPSQPARSSGKQGTAEPLRRVQLPRWLAAPGSMEQAEVFLKSQRERSLDDDAAPQQWKRGGESRAGQGRPHGKSRTAQGLALRGSVSQLLDARVMSDSASAAHLKQNARSPAARAADIQSGHLPRKLQQTPPNNPFSQPTPDSLIQGGVAPGQPGTAPAPEPDAFTGAPAVPTPSPTASTPVPTPQSPAFTAPPSYSSTPSPTQAPTYGQPISEPAAALPPTAPTLEQTQLAPSIERLQPLAPGSEGTTPAMRALAKGPKAMLNGSPPAPPLPPPVRSFTPFTRLPPVTSGACATVWDVITSTPQLSTWAGIIKSNTLQGPLQNKAATVTVFAPINDAFVRQAFLKPFFSCTNITCLLNNNPEIGRSLIAYASIPQAIPTTALRPGAIFNSSAAISLTPITVSVAPPEGKEIIIAGKGSSSRVLQAGLPACGPTPGGSWVHIVNSVLLPFLPTAAQPPGGAAGTAFAQSIIPAPPAAAAPGEAVSKDPIRAVG